MTKPLTRLQLDAPVTGYGIPDGTLGELLDERPTVLAFLRHFG